MSFAFSFSLRCGGKFRCKFIIVRVHLKFMNSSTAQYKEMLIQLKLSAPVPPSLQFPLPLDSLASQCHCDCVTILPVHRDDTTKLHACLMMWADTTTLVSPLLDDDATTWSGNVPCTVRPSLTVVAEVQVHLLLPGHSSRRIRISVSTTRVPAVVVLGGDTIRSEEFVGAVQRVKEIWTGQDEESWVCRMACRTDPGLTD